MRQRRKWDVQAAVTYVAEPGMKAVSEAIGVTVTGPATDPCGSITPGTPIVFDKMRVGFSAPEARKNGRGIRGGRRRRRKFARSKLPRMAIHGTVPGGTTHCVGWPVTFAISS